MSETSLLDGCKHRQLPSTGTGYASDAPVLRKSGRIVNLDEGLAK